MSMYELLRYWYACVCRVYGECMASVCALNILSLTHRISWYDCHGHHEMPRQRMCDGIESVCVCYVYVSAYVYIFEVQIFLSFSRSSTFR